MLLYMTLDETFVVYDLERKCKVYVCKSQVSFRFLTNRFFAIYFKENRDPLLDIDREENKQNKLTLLHVF